MDCYLKRMKVLGFGSFGTVYLARPSINYNGPPMALKSTNDVMKMKSLKWELHVLSRLVGTPNVVRCYGHQIKTTTSADSGEKKTFNLVLEYAPEGTLHDLIKRKLPHESQAACFTSMLLRGLAGIHSRGIVHCDLKPANILVFPGPMKDISMLKIADFGLARVSSSNEESEEKPRSVFWEGTTRKYYNRGTVMYASPESVESGRVDKCADIWSLGCIVYEMLTGKSIWKWNGEMEYLYDQILNKSIRAPNDVSIRAADFLARCLERDPAIRWSANELLEHDYIKHNIRIVKILRGVDVNQIV